MAVRFLVMLGSNAGRLAAVSALVGRRLDRRPAARYSDMVVFTNQPDALVATGDKDLLVLGRLFSRPTDPSSGSRDVREIAGSGSLRTASELLDRYWGGYVAIIRRPGSTGGVEILRDPSGALPCYRFDNEDLTFLCSDVDIAMASGCYAPVLDWDQLLRHLWAIAFRSRHTALSGLSEVPAGHCLIWRPAGTELVECWSPWAHVGRYGACSDEELAERLRATVRDSVMCLASGHDHVLHCLSGGLDSSIVAACLARGSTPFTAFNLVARGSLGDERSYALEVARHCGKELIEHRYTLDDVDFRLSSAAHLPRPVGEVVRLAFDRASNEQAARVGADAQFSGNGGDNVFCFLQSSTPLVDRLMRHGPGCGTWAALVNISRLTGTSIWQVLGHGIQRLRAGGPSYRWRPVTSYLDADAIASIAMPIRHPWLDAPPRALPGEAVHIALMMRPQNYTEGHPRTAPSELVTPLMAQPVMELCLGIPSWRWCAGGRDRSVARRAFADLLPRRVIDRRSKGGPAGFYHQIIEQKGPALREHLLDGVLARRGLLDRSTVDAYFRRGECGTGDEFVRILSLVDAESWTRSWLARASGTARSVMTG